MFCGSSTLECDVTETEFDTIQSPMRFGGGQVFQKTNASVLSRMVY